MKPFLVAAALAAIVTPGIALAGHVNVRQINQERRIDAGHRSGKLTDAEVTRLKAQQDAITAVVAKMRERHPHGLTGADKARLTAMQDEADRAIIGKKDNAQRGPDKLKSL